MSENLSIVGDVRKARQDFLALESGGPKAQLEALSDDQNRLLTRCGQFQSAK